MLPIARVIEEHFNVKIIMYMYKFILYYVLLYYSESIDESNIKYLKHRPQADWTNISYYIWVRYAAS